MIGQITGRKSKGYKVRRLRLRYVIYERHPTAGPPLGLDTYLIADLTQVLVLVTTKFRFLVLISSRLQTVDRHIIELRNTAANGLV